MSIYDSIIRLFVGIVWAGVFGGWLTSWVGVLALYPLITSMGGWCPIYAALKKYTNEDNPYTVHTHTLSGAHTRTSEKEGNVRMSA